MGSSTYTPIITNAESGVQLHALNKSSITYSPNIAYVDPGALSLATDAIGGAGQVVSSAIDASAMNVRDVLAANVTVTSEALNTSLDSIKQSLSASSAATADAIASANASASSAISSANSSADRVAVIADKSQGYAWENASEALGLTRTVIGAAFESAYDLNNLSMATVRNVADAYQSARETEVTAQFQDYRYILIAGLIVVGIVAFRAVK